jgi:hypothetical protein
MVSTIISKYISIKSDLINDKINHKNNSFYLGLFGITISDKEADFIITSSAYIGLAGIFVLGVFLAYEAGYKMAVREAHIKNQYEHGQQTLAETKQLVSSILNECGIEPPVIVSEDPIIQQNAFVWDYGAIILYSVLGIAVVGAVAYSAYHYGVWYYKISDGQQQVVPLDNPNIGNKAPDYLSGLVEYPPIDPIVMPDYNTVVQTARDQFSAVQAATEPVFINGVEVMSMPYIPTRSLDSATEIALMTLLD